VTLDAEYTLVGELIPGDVESIKTIAMHSKGNILDDGFEYNLADTPCENVVGKQFCYYEKNLQQLFPKDQSLKDMNAESYIGSPIFNSKGQPIGVLAAISTKPFKNLELAETLFRIMVIRCGAEIERKYAEKELMNLYELSQQTDIKLRQSESKLRALSAEMTIAEEQERRRIAADMHDHFVQNLGLSKIQLGALATHLSDNECLPLVHEVRGLTDQLIKEARSLVFEMSVPVLYELGLEAAIKWLAEETAKKTNFSCEVYDDGQSKPLKKEMQVILFKAVRELMTNIKKHAQADEVNIFIDRKMEQIVVCVQDDGVGFNPANIDIYHDDTKSFGLFGIKERMELMSGSVEIKSTPAQGTSITLSAPLEISTIENKTYISWEI
jgi:signal transduction histidine kinase